MYDPKLPLQLSWLSLGGNGHRLVVWESLIDKLKDKLKSKLDLWRYIALSKGGRVTLAQLVLNSLPHYYFSFLKAPEKAIDSMERSKKFHFGGVTNY